MTNINFDIFLFFELLVESRTDEFRKYDCNVISVNSSKLKSPEQLLDYLKQYKLGFTDIKYTVDYYKNSQEHCALSFSAEGTHNAIFCSHLPTGKKVTFNGLLQIYLDDDKFERIELMIDVDTIWKTIQCYSDKVYSEADFPANDFNGPAGNIYQALLYSRNPPSGIDQLLVNKFRWMFHQVNTDYIVDLPYLDEMNQAVEAQDLFIPANGSDIHVRWYKPLDVDYTSAPTVVYFHGGGWIMASVDSYDLVTRKLCWRGKVNVFSVDYRLAPENPFPTYYMDCYKSFETIRDQLSKLGINNLRIAVAGDSAGGTMAGGLVHYLHKHKKILPDAVLMLSPCTDLLVTNYPSFIKKAQHNVFLSIGLAVFQISSCVPPENHKDPIYSPMHGDFSYFPPSFVMIGDDDPLAEDNYCLLKKLKKAGVSTVTELIGKVI